MSWNEFCSLLQGLGPETPLARTVQIRLETDKEVLKNFTSSQHKIRNKWRSRNVKHYSDEDIEHRSCRISKLFCKLVKATPNGVAVLLQNFISVHHNGVRCFYACF